MRKLLIVLVVIVVLIAALFGVVALTSPSRTGTQVNLVLLSFHPGTLTVPAGTTVTWTDKDPFTKHDVIGQGFASPNLSRGQSYSFKFTQPGTYEYKCSHHPWMKGKVIVK